MKRSILRWASALLVASGLALQARADTINNTFDTGHDYVANGIIGDSSWDGVYLRLGDVPFGNAGGSPNGTTQQANTSDFPGFLAITTSGTDWSAAGDDGFFLFRVVAGDFDMSAQVVGPYDARANNFEGLMARAYQTNNTGAPFSPSTTNATENWLALLRMQQFNDDGEIRQATNGVNQEFVFPGVNSDTNTSRYLRITRTGNLFSFFWKTNDSDPWFPLTNAAGTGGTGTISRPDLAGIAMQVGIQGSAFSTAQRQAFFDNFQLIATNVTSPAGPAAPSNVAMVSSNITGSATITWTPGAGAAGSLVVVRQNGRMISFPVQGANYTADTSFTNNATLMDAGRTHVVYVGTGNSVTVTGLGGTNNTYDVAVYSYSGSGSSIVYNRNTPSTTQFIGPGQVAQVTFTLSPPQIPAGGAAVAQVTATYTSGDSYDVSSDPNTIWTPVDPTVVAAGNGVVTGLTNGTTSVIATYANVPGTNSVTVVTPAFVDNFNVSNNYITNGVLGSTWDGIYLGAGDVPFQIPANYGANPGVVTNCDANVTTNGMLTIIHNQTGWEVNEDDGFFLFKYVPGDFQAAVKIESYQNQAFQFPGLMARLFAPGGGALGTTNTTFTHGRENYVRWMRFDEFNISTSARANNNGANNAVADQGDGDTVNFWLLMVRRGTSFTMYRRVNPTDNWTAIPAATRTLALATNGAAMQVGLEASTFDTGSPTAFRSVNFSHFMLDATNIAAAGTPPPAATVPKLTANQDGTLTLVWTNGAGSAGSLVVVRAARLVNVKPIFGITYTANSVFGQGTDLGSGNFAVYSGTGTTVTVSGLVPGTTYYATVFSYSGAGATTAYNTLDTRQTSIQALGQAQSLTFKFTQGNSLLNGGVLPYTVIVNYTGGVSNDVTTQAIILPDSSVTPGWAIGTNGFLTGVTNGTASVYATFGGVSATNSVIVRSPNLKDDFTVAHDYLNNGVAGIWDGVFLGSSANYPSPNSIPGSTGVGQTVIADANTTSNNMLIVQAHDTTWSGTGNNGFLLWRYVPSDFQSSVYIAAIDKNTNGQGSVGFQFSGLMARAFGNTNDTSAVPYNGSENWVYFGEFEQFADSTEARHALNGADNELALFDSATNDFRLLMRRQGGTFTFFRRVGATDPWTFLPNQTINRADLATVPMQVGLFQATYSAAVGTTAFANFMLDDAAPKIGLSNVSGSLSLTWPADPLLNLQSAGGINPGQVWAPVAGTPGTTNGAANLIVPITNPLNPSSQFYRLSR